MVRKKVTIVNALKSLSDTNRLRALYVLREHELCACQLVELLNLTPSTVSKHMSLLINSGFVESRKDGKWVYYKLNTSEHLGLIKELLLSMDQEEIFRDDLVSLESILKLDPEELCKQQRRTV